MIKCRKRINNQQSLNKKTGVVTPVFLFDINNFLSLINYNHQIL